MGDIGMIKGGACLVAQTRRVVGDVVQHRSSIGVSLEVYRREEGQETVNTSKHKHNKTTGGARGALTQGYTIPAKGDNIRESFPEVWHFRTNEPEGEGWMFAVTPPI